MLVNPVSPVKPQFGCRMPCRTCQGDGFLKGIFAFCGWRHWRNPERGARGSDPDSPFLCAIKVREIKDAKARGDGWAGRLPAPASR